MYMNNEILKKTTDSRTYRLIVREINWVEDRRNMCYVSTYSKRDNRNWKNYRKTQWKKF